MTVAEAGGTGPSSQPRTPSAQAQGAATVMLPAGRVGRAHGLDGSFYVTRPVPRLLAEGVTVEVDGSGAARIERRAGTDRRPILRLAGVADRAGAEALRGRQLSVGSDRAPTLGEGEWWEHELKGCEVRDGERLLGVVSALIELPSCEALQVQPSAGGEPLLVPMVGDAVRDVSVAQRRIEVDLDFLAFPEPERGRP